ncbi:MAG: MucBP domain-containing protein, partial [Streptococcaceae bacterium]|nr:MucBP domain-containing protein [Streptococcaceae bacterium]
HGHIYYYDNRDTQFHTPDDFIWWDNVAVNIPHPHFDDYDYTHEEHRGDAQHPELNYHYNWMRKVTLNYISEDGTYLGSDTIRGVYGQSYDISAPSSIGYYELESASDYSGIYGTDNQVINVVYRYVPPIIYYYTSNPNAGVFYANGYEYVPIYVTPSYQDYSDGGSYDNSGSDSNSENYDNSDSNSQLPNTGDINDNTSELRNNMLGSLIEALAAKLLSIAAFLKGTIEESIIGTIIDGLYQFTQPGSFSSKLLKVEGHAIIAIAVTAATALSFATAWLLWIFRAAIISALDAVFDWVVDHILKRWLK